MSVKFKQNYNESWSYEKYILNADDTIGNLVNCFLFILRLWRNGKSVTVLVVLARIPEFLKLHWDVVDVVVNLAAIATVQTYIDTGVVSTAHVIAMTQKTKKLDAVPVIVPVAINSSVAFGEAKMLQNVNHVMTHVSQEQL